MQTRKEYHRKQKTFKLTNLQAEAICAILLIIAAYLLTDSFFDNQFVIIRYIVAFVSFIGAMITLIKFDHRK